LINEKDSYTKHRCYTYDDECICECVDAPTYVNRVGLTYEAGGSNGPTGNTPTAPQEIRNRHQEGNLQASLAGLDLKRSTLTGLDHVKAFSAHKVRRWNANGQLIPLNDDGANGRMTGQSVFQKKDRFWKPPNYYVSHEEVEAIKTCCEKPNMQNAPWISHNSAFAGMTAGDHPMHVHDSSMARAGATWDTWKHTSALKGGQDHATNPARGEQKCADIKDASEAQIKEWLAEISPTITNEHVKQWLNANACAAPQYGTYTDGWTGNPGYDAINDGPDYDVNDQVHSNPSKSRPSSKSTIQFSHTA
jgi:hypothetical protein